MNLENGRNAIYMFRIYDLNGSWTFLPQQPAGVQSYRSFVQVTPPEAGIEFQCLWS